MPALAAASVVLHPGLYGYAFTEEGPIRELLNSLDKRVSRTSEVLRVIGPELSYFQNLAAVIDMDPKRDVLRAIQAPTDTQFW